MLLKKLKVLRLAMKRDKKQLKLTKKNIRTNKKQKKGIFLVNLLKEVV